MSDFHMPNSYYEPPETPECPECDGPINGDDTCEDCGWSAPTVDDFADAAYERAMDK